MLWGENSLSAWHVQFGQGLVELLMCAWCMGQEIAGMKILTAQVFEILHQTVERGLHVDWEFRSTLKRRFFRWL